MHILHDSGFHLVCCVKRIAYKTVQERYYVKGSIRLVIYVRLNISVTYTDTNVYV